MLWEASLQASDLKPKEEKSEVKKDDENEDDDVPEQDQNVQELEAKTESNSKSKLFYSRSSRHFLKDALPLDSKAKVDLTSADFHAKLKLLVTGFDSGVFLIHDMPDLTLIHSLSISNQSILTVAFNPSGDWLAFGCAKVSVI